MLGAMSTQSFVTPPQGRFAVGCASVFIGLPAIGAAASLASASPFLVPLPLLLAAALLAIAYYVFNEEVRVELDERSLRLSRSRVIFGRRLSDRTDWEIPVASLTRAKEVRTKTPASKGGWNHRAVLQLPEGRTLDARELGGQEDHQSAYNALVRALGKRLGPALEREATIG
jgi:hypothetical protein